MNKYSKVFKILLFFLIFMSFCVNAFASSSIEKKLELFEKRIEFESDVSAITVFVSFMLIIVGFIIIILCICLYKKIPKTLLYILFAVSVVTICVVTTLYGDELTSFCEQIITYQMKLLNSKGIL